MKKHVSVLIPTWNGRHLLEKYLADNCEILDHETDRWEIVIIDNESTDGTVDWLKKTWGHDQRIHVIALAKNLGFGPANNIGLETVQFPLTFMLNNDVRLVPGSIKPLYAVMGSDTFAAFPWQKVIGKTATVFGGCGVKFHFGMYRYGDQFGGDFLPQYKPRPSWYAQAAAAIFDTNKLRQLGGFASHYSPAYWEDVDLSHRAWQRGWTVISVPSPAVDHWHESTAKTIPHWRLQALQERNWWLLHWTNLRQARFWWRHFAWLGVNLIRETSQKPAAPLGLLWALWYIPHVVVFRSRQVVVRNDQAIIVAACATATRR